MTIRELIDGLRKLDMVLPEFQREYVWEREQAKQLMVSLYNGYPTGSLLFWKTDNPPDIKNTTIPRDKIVPSSAHIDKAIDVFDRVNSLGTKLTDADLALAHITGKWPQARQVMKEKIQELESKRFAFDLTFMVRCLTGVVHGRALF